MTPFVTPFFTKEYQGIPKTKIKNVDLTTVNSKIEAKRTELDDAKQEVNELIRSERLSKLASSQEMTQNNENIRTAE